MYTFGTLKRMVMAKVGAQLAMQVTDEELEQAINDAISDVRTEMPYNIAPDTSITLVALTYEYSLAALPFIYIKRITMGTAAPVTYPATHIIPGWWWAVIAGPTLKFDENAFDPVAGRTLRIEGQALQAPLVADTDICYISDSFVVTRAAGTLLGGLGSPRESIMLRMAEDARQRSPFLPAADSVHVRR